MPVEIDREGKHVTREMYDESAARWVRRGPQSLSDFTARPVLLEMCEPVAGRRVLDLGCGEGYVARQLAARGAERVTGLDLSEKMIAAACRQEEAEPEGIDYAPGCATDLGRFAAGSFDLVVAVFLFNYLTIAETDRCMSEIARVLRPGGQLVLSVPHPSFPFLRGAAPPFYFEVGEAGYFTARDTRFPGRIWKRDGESLGVALVHKSFEDYFDALRKGGFTAMPEIRELKVAPEHLALDPAFFGALVDLPLHVALRVRR